MAMALPVAVAPPAAIMVALPPGVAVMAPLAAAAPIAVGVPAAMLAVAAEPATAGMGGRLPLRLAHPPAMVLRGGRPGRGGDERDCGNERPEDPRLAEHLGTSRS